MSIFNNLFTGTSGINAHGGAISVVGDNIANVSTTGYKSSRAGFSDVLGGRLGTDRLGSGVRLDGTQTSYQQGSLQQTGGVFDMAIRGNGFFVMNGNNKGQEGQFFSRDGRFALDQDGFVVNQGGLRLQGYDIAPDGTQATGLSDIQLGANQEPPSATTEVDMAMNLDSGSTIPPAWDATDPGGTSNYSTSVTVYDSLGEPHRVDMYFRHDGGGNWEWHGMVDGGELTGGTPGTPTEIASGTLSFTPDGALDTETIVSSSADFVDAQPGQSITFDFGDAVTTDGGTGLAGTTQFSGPFNINAMEQDGFGYGDLVDIAISDDGTIEGSFSNGQSRALARVGLAEFASEDGLERAGDSMFAATASSGEALIDAAATGGRGAISAGALENSNVDLSSELVTLIQYQRAFQANVRSVQTADEMLSEIANLKR